MNRARGIMAPPSLSHHRIVLRCHRTPHHRPDAI